MPSSIQNQRLSLSVDPQLFGASGPPAPAGGARRVTDAERLAGLRRRFDALQGRHPLPPALARLFERPVSLVAQVGVGLVALGLLVAFAVVVQGAVGRAEGRRAALAAREQAALRCGMLGRPDARTQCLAQWTGAQSDGGTAPQQAPAGRTPRAVALARASE